MVNIGKKSAKNGRLKQRTEVESKHLLLFSVLFGCLYFIAVCLCGVETNKTSALVLSAVALLVLVERRRLLEERIGVLFLTLALFVVLNGISSFYAISGKFGLREFLKVLSAFCLGLALLGLSPKTETHTGSAAMTVLAVCGALGSLVSIDLISTRWISGAILGFFNLFTVEYRELEGVEAGIRMTSMFKHPNVFAGFSGIGVLLSLGLALRAEGGRKRCVYLVLLYVNALAFILAFSMGASAFIALAFLVFLFLLPKEERGGALVLMLETFLLVVVSAALISATSFQSWTMVNPIPLACTVCGAALLCLLDRGVRKLISGRLKPTGRLVPILIISVLVLMAAYLAAAWNVTGEAELTPGTVLRRAVYLEPGEYKLELGGEGEISVWVESQNRLETMMHSSTVLYQGDAAEAAITVPEDSLVQFFNFSSNEGARILSASCGGTKIPLAYKLLPGFIANRLQGLLANENAIQRLVFFEDGFKLFKRSPVIGLGMGAFENGIMSVQSFYYETKYAHDHYIQVLVETGVVGLILFLGLLVVCCVAVWKSRKEKPFAPVLGAALVFMAGHAATEVVFSYFAYLPMAYGTFALIELCCGDAVKRPRLSTLAKRISMALIAVLIFIYCLFVICNISAKNLIQREPTLNSVSRAMSLDKFEWADYALAYVTNTMGDNVGTNVRVQADQYAERLAKVNSNTTPIYLAQYYFTTGRTEKGFEMLEKYVDYLASDTKAWQAAFDMARELPADSDVYKSGMTRLAAKLDAWNAENLGTILLDQETEAFLEQYR